MAEPQMATAQARPAVAKNGHPPVFIGWVGIGLLLFWAMGIMAQIQTNEAFVTNGGQVNVFKPDWSIVWQPIAMATGNLTSSEGMAVMFGWGVELLYLALIAIGVEMLKHAASRSGQVMGKVFITLTYGIVFFNGWTDYSYGSVASGQLGHIGFACIMSFVVGFFGPIGMFMFEKAWGHV